LQFRLTLNCLCSRLGNLQALLEGLNIYTKFFELAHGYRSNALTLPSVAQYNAENYINDLV
jgi:hypothetical protein